MKGKVGRIILFAAIIVSVGGMNFLYQKQLGSISFLILSIVFFILGFRLLKKRQ
jgi:membrane protein implicated in regulation of membrane protease activity